MPDVSRSDSQRSDKPRVSFNRDVHVKRIGSSGLVGALAGDGEGHLVPLAVRRERPGGRSRRQEAEEVLRQADRVYCTPHDKFSTLPPSSRHRASHSGHPPASSLFNSLDRRSKKKKTPEGTGSVRLKRRYSNPDNSWRPFPPDERPQDVPQRKKLNRSVSDAGRREEKKDREFSIFGTLDRIRKKKKTPSLAEATKREEVVPPVRKKKQLSPIIEMSPRVEGDAWRFAPTDVVYAEVVARPNGKTTVHTAVPASPSAQPPRPESEEDEGVDMGHRGRRYSYEGDLVTPTSPKRELDISPRGDDISGDKIINMLRSRSNPLLDDELVGGYRREVRTERVVRVEESGERGRADGMDFSKRRSSKDLVEEEILPKISYGEDRKNYSYDDLDRIKYHEPIRAWTPPLETSLIDSNDLSYRRDRLESRLTHHTRRFASSAHHDTHRGEDLRKDFLISQLNGDKEKGYFEKKIATEIDTHRQHMLKNKDVFSDSGIEMSDYRKDSSNVATLNRRNVETSRVVRSESRAKSIPVLNKTDYHSDGEKRYKGDISTKFIEEERRRKEVVPPSSTLVKSYSKSKEDKTATRREESTKDKKNKLTRMDKVKQLMFGSKEGKKNKKKKKEEDDAEELLRSRYTEYKGSDVSVNSSPVTHRRRQTSSSEVDDRTDQEVEMYSSRQRLATPSPSHKTDDTWFKSLTRRNKLASTKHTDKKARMNGHGGTESSSKHLRFFGDSDQESLKSAQLQRGRPHQAPDSSESTTEGEHSHQSQKSVVYLHAATVGDIPGSRKLHRSVLGERSPRRAQSREELSSSTPPEMSPHSRTLSRSISVLAPWRPKLRREVNYDSEGKPPRAPTSRPRSHLADRSKSARDLRKSKENLADNQNTRGSSESIFSEKKRGTGTGTLKFVGKRDGYDTVDKHRGNHTIDRSHRTRSTDRLSDKRDLSRSISIPKDSRVSSGWFKGKTAKAK